MRVYFFLLPSVVPGVNFSSFPLGLGLSKIWFVHKNTILGYMLDLMSSPKLKPEDYQMSDFRKSLGITRQSS